MAPFKSKAQLRKFAQMVKTGEITQSKFDEWASATKNTKKLPERVSRPAGVKKVRVLK